MKKYFFYLFSLLQIMFSLNAFILGAEKSNKVQLAILLDTSGSMEGLIEQTKTQLWKIVNELARASKSGKEINLEVALLEYGKSTIPSDEGYLRIISPFTNDLDRISSELFKLETNGGDEYCGAVLRSAVRNLEWSSNNENLKIIFIAGNEPFTQGEIDYRVSCINANSRRIIVNTIYCGDYQEGTSTNWKDGADLASGRYMNIDHNQKIVHIKAPQDRELIILGKKLNSTYIGYGKMGKEKKVTQEEQDENAMFLAAEVMVERTVTKGSSQYKNSEWDLVDATSDGKVKLENLSQNELPEEMKKMTTEERDKYIKEKVKERKTIQNKINELNEIRRKYVAKKILDTDNTTTLDAVIIKTIKEQAESKDFRFK